MTGMAAEAEGATTAEAGAAAVVEEAADTQAPDRVPGLKRNFIDWNKKPALRGLFCRCFEAKFSFEVDKIRC
jgi:hypothetical protein